MLHISDEQIVRLFELVDEIRDVKMSIPQPPPGFAVTPTSQTAVQTEIAHQSREGLDQHLVSLIELRGMLELALELPEA